MARLGAARWHEDSGELLNLRVGEISMAWDGAEAEREIRRYAGDESGKPIPSRARRCYLKVVGDGTKWGDYSYPYVRIKDGKPVPDLDGLRAAWVYARQHDPQLLRDIISICRRAGFELTPAMAEWARRHMRSQSMDIRSEGVVFESDSEIHVLGVVMREGVYNGALQEYSDFVLDAPALIGTKLIRGDHPRSPDGAPRALSPGEDTVIGEIIDVRPVPERRALMATWRLLKSQLTGEELERIRSGTPIGTSLGYWCSSIDLERPMKHSSGARFTRIERGPREFDHVATPARPACRDCGILFLNSDSSGGAMTDINTQSNTQAPDSAPQDGGDCSTVVNGTGEASTAQTDAATEIRAAIESMAAQLRALSEDLASLRAAEAARAEAERAAAEESRRREEQSMREMFMSWLKPGKESEAEQLWERARENPWRFRFENPGLFVGMSEEVRYSPSGSSRVQLGAQSERRVRDDGLVVNAATSEIDWESMGIKSPAQLARELGYSV